MHEPLVHSHYDQGVLELVFARVAKRNAFTLRMYQELTAALQAADQDPDTRSILLHGGGDNFTAGNDLAEFARAEEGIEGPPLAFLAALVDATKPVVAAVQGVAVGIGTTMLLHCDLVYAANDARFRLPFVDLGLCPEGGSTLLLPRDAGTKTATELLLLAEVFSAQRALEAGLVTQVLPTDQVLEHARERARMLALKPPAALAATKRLLREPRRTEIHAALAREAEIFAQLLRAPEATFAIQTFLGRRRQESSS